MQPEDKPKKLRYDLLNPEEHILASAFNGDLEELKLALARIDTDRPNFTKIISIAEMNQHRACIDYLKEQEKVQREIEITRRLEAEKNVPKHHRKVCSACGPVITKYSNCPRCWGPVQKDRSK